MDSTIDIEGKEKIKREKFLESLQNLEDSLVNELFIAVINLMKYMCLESAVNDKNDYFDVISNSLNKNDRELALFNCLNIDDDQVRLAVVGCLYTIDLT